MPSTLILNSRLVLVGRNEDALKSISEECSTLGAGAHVIVKLDKKNLNKYIFSIWIDFKNNFCAVNILTESGRLQTTGAAIYRPWLKILGSLKLQ